MTLFGNVSNFLLRNYLVFNGKLLISAHHLLSPSAYLTCCVIATLYLRNYPC